MMIGGPSGSQLARQSLCLLSLLKCSGIATKELSVAVAPPKRRFFIR